MIKLQKKPVSFTVIFIILLILIAGAAYILTHKSDFGFASGNASTTAENHNTESYSANIKIKAAFEDFLKYSKNNPDVRGDALCTGGFVNEANPTLKNISEDIIKNRILNLDTKEYATTQDDAGMACIANGSNWVLFTALNADDTNAGKDFYCVDSTGEKGNEPFDIDTARCVK